MSEETNDGAGPVPVVEGQPGRHCGRYARGHDTHWIQAKKAHGAPVTTGTIERRGDHMALIIEDGTRIELWWHDHERILALAEDREAEYISDFGVLRVPTGGGRLDRATFSVAEHSLDRCGPKASVRPDDRGDRKEGADSDD